MTIQDLFYAFCSGAFGTMIGASGAFAMTGCMCAIGMAALFGAGGDFLHSCVTFGPMLLPAVTFAGGAAAAHYARWRGYVPRGEGRNISPALLTLGKPDVILFGGFIGALGYAANSLMGSIGLSRVTDTSATFIMVIALMLKGLFDRELTGQYGNRWTDRYRSSAPGWQSAMSRPFDAVLYGGLIAGMAACCVSAVLSSENSLFAKYGIFVPFGVSCLVLLLGLGGTKVPTTHHITLCAAYAMANGGGSIGWGVVAGILASVAGEVLGRTFHLHGDCYVDPAAMAICTVTPIVQWLLPMTGLYGVLPEVLPFLLIAVTLVAIGAFQARQTRKDAPASPAA